jgi:hypothetical protein
MLEQHHLLINIPASAVQGAMTCKKMVSEFFVIQPDKVPSSPLSSGNSIMVNSTELFVLERGE